MRRVLPVLLLAVLAGALGAGCGGEATVATPESISLRELSAAGRTSADATTGRFEFSLEMAFPGADEPFAFGGEGTFDATANRAALTMDLSGLASLFGGLFGGAGATTGAPDFDDPSLWQIEAVQDGTVMYLRFPAVASELPAGKSWVRVDLREAGKLQGFDFSQLEQFTQNDPRQILDYLQAASGDVTTVGAEDVRGVGTTHYRATVDLLRYQQLVPAAKREELGSMLEDLVDESGIREVPVDVWVDAHGLVRRLTMAFSATQPGTSDTVQASMRFELYDYGKDVAIAIPSPSQVVDGSALRS